MAAQKARRRQAERVSGVSVLIVFCFGDFLLPLQPQSKLNLTIIYLSPEHEYNGETVPGIRN